MGCRRREILGELTGTFLLVLFGCGSVTVDVLFGVYHGLLQIALVWGIGVALAIYMTRHLSCAHLNPAVTLAMVLSGRMPLNKLLGYVFAQLIGAILAGSVLYALFADTIAAYELVHNIQRGQPESIKTAMLFGEFYPNPALSAVVSMPLAMVAEGCGTFLLVLMIFALTEGSNVGRPDESLAPVFIGLTVSSIICLLAPLTQAGLNPARDFGPRLVASIAGWGDAAFPPDGGAFWVYIFAPLCGAALACFFFIHILDPAMRSDK
jgi:glycerol uptake facilitator protein